MRNPRCVELNELTESEQRVVADVINLHGDGQHPVAELTNLDFFGIDYALQCAVKEILKLRQQKRKSAIALSVAQDTIARALPN